MANPWFCLRCLLFIIYTLFVLRGCCTTHWLLTEDGKIQAQMDSIFQLRRPYDFLALAQQEQRALQVEALKKELLSQKSQIDHNEDKDTQLEERIYRTDSDCVLAGKPLTDFNLYESVIVPLDTIGIRVEEYLPVQHTVPEFYSEPDCEKGFPLPYSMFALEHLQGVRYRDNLTAEPEEDIKTLGAESDVWMWGNRVARALEEAETSSWVLFSIAAHYWRVQGVPFKAVECLRRALHYSSRTERHIPLVHLGNVLHRSHHSDEAALVFHMAVDHHRHTPVSHTALGNVYATLAFYNVSVLCYENALYMTPGDQELRKRKHAVLCHSHLEGALERQHQSLQRTLNELRDYQKRHEEWLNLQQKLLLEQATPEMKLESRLEYEEQKIRESTDGRGQDCFQYQQDGHTFLSCNMRRDQLEQRGSPSELLLDLQSLLHTVESEALRLGQHVLKRKPSLAAPVPYITPLQPAKSDRRSVMAATVAAALGDNFASPEQCEKAPPLPQWDAFPTVFLPAENKGFSVRRFLSDDIGVSLNDVHPLPWHPPICERMSQTVEGIDSIPGIKERHLLTTRLADPHALPYFTDYGHNGDEAEVGQRISSAMKKGVGPQWLLYNLAGLYWRVQGNLYNGVECLRRAVSSAPAEWRDVPLINLAALLYTAGHIDDALTITLQAIAVDDHEPQTNFLLANLYCGKGNLTGAWYHYERVLLAAPDHKEAKQFITALACHTRPSHTVTVLPTCQNSVNGDGVCASDGGCPSTGSGTGSGGSVNTAETDKGVNQVNTDNIKTEDSINENNPGSSSSTSSSSSSSSSTSTSSSIDKDIDPIGPESKANDKQVPARIVVPGGPDDPITQSVITYDTEASSTTTLIEDDPLPDVLLRVRERVASPPPPPHVCERANKLNDIKHFTSTWLSVSAKNIDIAEFLATTPSEGSIVAEPVCANDLPTSLHTLDHLAGVRHRFLLPPFPEMGLREALQTLTDRTPVPLDTMATRIHRSLKKNETSWVVATAAALYWRVVGSGTLAVDCLRHALHYAPRHMKDIPLISLANILHRAGLYNNALVVANMALEISPKFVVIHFTMANIYAAKGDLEKATAFYQSTLALQSSFEPARDRLRAIQCASSNAAEVDNKL